SDVGVFGSELGCLSNNVHIDRGDDLRRIDRPGEVLRANSSGLLRRKCDEHYGTFVPVHFPEMAGQSQQSCRTGTAIISAVSDGIALVCGDITQAIVMR